MRKNIENVLMALFVAVFVVSALGLILNNRLMTSIALCVLTVIVGVFAGIQVYDFLAKDTVVENADPQRNKTLLITVIVSVAIFLALLAVTIFHLCGKLF